MDEDTCATNFMMRYSNMHKLVNKRDVTITTYIDKVSQLNVENKISTVFALGGIGDYFDDSNLVIQKSNYQALDKTRQAHEIAKNSPIKRAIKYETYLLKNDVIPCISIASTY